MASILGIIQQYKGDLVLFPIVSVLLIVLTLILFLLAYQYRKLKYFPGIIAIVAGTVIGLLAFKTMEGKTALNMLWLGICLFTGGWIALGTAWIASLIDSLQKGKKKAEKWPDE
jgi:asparagine N-glycosylation enzyme membrane subunit Stt3